MRTKKIMDNFTEDEIKEIVANNVDYTNCLKVMGYKAVSGDTLKTFKNKLAELNIDTSHFTTYNFINHRKRYSSEDIFIQNSLVSQNCLRTHYKQIYPPEQCAICGQETSWNNKELIMILDHINGHNHDNRLENLRWVCPNCNSQLSTTGSRNYKS